MQSKKGIKEEEEEVEEGKGFYIIFVLPLDIKKCTLCCAATAILLLSSLVTLLCIALLMQQSSQ